MMLLLYNVGFDKINLLQLIDDLDIGGAEKVLLNLTNFLNRDDYNLFVYSFENGMLTKDFIAQGIKPIIMNKKYSCDLTLLFRLLRLIRKRQIHLVHCHLLIATIYGGIAAKLLGIPFIVTIHGRGILDLKRGTDTLRMAGRYAKKIVAVSASLKNELIKVVGLKPEKIAVIHNGVDLKEYCSHSSTIASKKKLGIQSFCHVVGSVGVLRSVKGYEYLLLSVPNVLQAFPDTKFVFVGDGPLKEKLQKMAWELNIQDAVMFLGYRKDIPDVLSAFDIFVLPSLTEGSPNVLLEAMAASIPVVVTNVGGISEIVVDGVTGILLPPKCPDKLSAAIIELLGSEYRRLTMGNFGFERVKEHFSIEATTRKYAQVYEYALRK